MLFVTEKERKWIILLKQIEKEIHKLETIQSKINTLLEHSPEGKLRCAVNRGHYQYYMGKKYLGADQKRFIKQLAQKEYCMKMNKSVSKYLKMWEDLKNMYQCEALEDIYRKLHPARKLVIEPLVTPVENLIEEFEKLEYQGLGFREEDETAYYTAKGERVRSKSEKIIADELQRYNIPYKYELPLNLREKNRIKIIYPDFTVINRRNGHRWFIEHLGMMDDAVYCEKNMRKLDLYERNGILLGNQLLVFHETYDAPLNVNVMKKYIEKYLI